VTRLFNVRDGGLSRDRPKHVPTLPHTSLAFFNLRPTNPHSHGRDQEGDNHESAKGLEAGRTGLSFGTESRSKPVSCRVPKADTRTKRPLPGFFPLPALGASAPGKLHSRVAWPHFTNLISTSFAFQHARAPFSKLYACRRAARRAGCRRSRNPPLQRQRRRI
jgi:hypothetical protein